MRQVNWSKVEDRNYFYGTRPWRRLRKIVLDKEPLCRHCKAEGRLVGAVDIDHIIPLEKMPSMALEITNLCPLCKSCHSKKTALEMGFGPKEEYKIINRKWKI